MDFRKKLSCLKDSNTLSSWTSQLRIVCKCRALLKIHNQHNAN